MSELNQDAIDFLESSAEQSMGSEAEAESKKLIADSISSIVSSVDEAERSTRDQMLKQWKYLELLWSGSGNYYWDHDSNQWTGITQEDIASLSTSLDIDPTMINKVINLIRPYGESLAGVLTTGLPRIRYFPEDADNELDIVASKGYSTVERKITDDNLMQLRLIEILVKMWNGGFAAAYNYTHEDKKYGVDREPIMEDRIFNQETQVCINCGAEQILSETEVPEIPEIPTESEYDEEDSDISLDEQLKPELDYEVPDQLQAHCPECEQLTNHITVNDQISKPVQTGMNEIPKCREIIEIYGPMNIKFSSLATKKKHIYWLIHEEELDVAYLKSHYPQHREKIVPGSDANLDIDRSNRNSGEIDDDTLSKAATIRTVWLKKAAYEYLDEEKRTVLEAAYPNGLKAIFCGDTFLEAEEEDMDDHWTISINPLYKRIMADPLGKALIGPHETANDLFHSELDTVKYTVPMMFADPAFFNFDAHNQTRSAPGTISPLKKPPNGSLKDVIAEGPKATLPNGIEYLDSKVEKLMQFISGILPPIFGGGGGGSKTLGEYQESKNQALQRLSIIWKIVTVMYSELMAKATKQYVKALKKKGRDVNYVVPKGKDSFMNVWIRHSDFEGEIGEVRPEITEQFPMSWGQISARIMELLGLNNDVITGYFLHPENVELIYQTLGITDMYIPDEDQRNKQLYEISQMISQPSVMPDPMTGEPMPVQIISTPLEPMDDHKIHAAVTAAFLNSPVGIDLQQREPLKYKAILGHFQAHVGQVALMMEQEQKQIEKANKKSNFEPVGE